MAKKKNTRAANGMGSIRQRPDGRWEARYSAPDGRQRSVYGKTQRECTEKLRAALHEVDSGQWREPSRMTVGEWMEIWLTDYQGHTSKATVYGYRACVRKNILPIVGEIRMDKLAPIHFQRVISALRAAGLKESTAANYMAIFQSAIRTAVDAGIIKVNPAEGFKRPRIPPRQFRVIDRADIPTFIALAGESKHGPEMVLMLMTGLRLGELRGLRWGDIDFDAGTMHVQRQIHPVRAGMKNVTPPKYGEDRIIFLPADAIKLLREQRKRQAEQRLASTTWQDDDTSRDLVFRRNDGGAVGEHTIYRHVKKVGLQMGIPDLHPHDMRHSYAVAALRSGVDVKTVQHNLGHRTSQMPLDVYAAYTSDAGKQGAEKLSEYLRQLK